MVHSSSPFAVDPPKVTDAEVHRFDSVADIRDFDAFAAELEALVQEKVASADRDAANAKAWDKQMQRNAAALRAQAPWRPSSTDIQRGRKALLEAFEQPHNLPLPEFVKLAGKSRQQIYKDLAAHPPRLLALTVGPRKQRLPDWQLDPVRLRLTQAVLEHSQDVDAWTIYNALSEPLESLRNRSPVSAVTPGNLGEVVKSVCGALGIH